MDKTANKTIVINISVAGERGSLCVFSVLICRRSSLSKWKMTPHDYCGFFLIFVKIDVELSTFGWLFSNAIDHPTYYSHSHVEADKLTGRSESGCQNQTSNFAGLHPLGVPRLAIIQILRILEIRFNCSTTVFGHWFITII
jgi:hypothetical protein